MRRATYQSKVAISPAKISIHALLAESDVNEDRYGQQFWRFLSTLSLRRATPLRQLQLALCRNFYPRSPCGERLIREPATSRDDEFLSTLSLRRATPCRSIAWRTARISIHALLAESDAGLVGAGLSDRISIHALLAESDSIKPIFGKINANFYPRSPCGERRKPYKLAGPELVFLSTLSLRRATGCAQYCTHAREISIHALLAESDTLI